jgi:hypothetical protein
MDPVDRREIIEGKEILLILCKAFKRFGVFVFKRIYKVAEAESASSLVGAIYISRIMDFV